MRAYLCALFGMNFLWLVKWTILSFILLFRRRLNDFFLYLLLWNTKSTFLLKKGIEIFMSFYLNFIRVEYFFTTRILIFWGNLNLSVLYFLGSRVIMRIGIYILSFFFVFFIFPRYLLFKDILNAFRFNVSIQRNVLFALYSATVSSIIFTFFFNFDPFSFLS